MNAIRTIVAVTALSALLPLSACSDNKAPAGQAQQQQQPAEKSFVSEAVTEAIAEAKQELRKGNLTISEREPGLTKAEITPQGDLLIGGRQVAINPQQRALLLEYRAQTLAIAESGMEIGVQGADLATKAVGKALTGVLLGKSEQEVERSVEAEAAGVKASAARLCGRLPAMMDTQHKLAAALPEFRPYATMTQDDIDDCMKDADKETTASAAAAAEKAADAAEKKPAAH